MQPTQAGATAIEYSLMVLLIAAVVIVGVGLVGSTVAGLFQTTVNALTP